jgi:hypothetical protein
MVRAVPAAATSVHGALEEIRVPFGEKELFLHSRSDFVCNRTSGYACSLSPQDDQSIIVLLVEDNLRIAVIDFTPEGFTIPLIHNVDVIATNRTSESFIAFGIGADFSQMRKQATRDIHPAMVLGLGDEFFNKDAEEEISVFCWCFSSSEKPGGS